MQPVKVLVVEDELIIAKDLKITLEEMNYEVVGIASSFEQAKQKLLQHKPDIAILDIFLTRENEGVEIAHFIRQNFQMPFIFLTSYTDTSTLSEAKKTQPNAYLVKPFQTENLYTAIEIAIFNYAQLLHLQQNILPKNQPNQENNQSEKNIISKENTQTENIQTQNLIIEDVIFVKNGDFFVKIYLQDILYFQSEKNYIEVFTEKNKYIIRNTLSDLHKSLKKDDFMRVHKSYIIQKSHIKALNSTEIQMKNNQIIPIGRVYKEEIMQFLKHIRFS